MKILAIDPGSVCAGYGVLALEGRHLRYIASGVLRFNGKDDFLDRIKFIYEQTRLLMDTYRPDEVALESLIYVKSPTSLMKLAQARGAMLAAVTQQNVTVHEYAPTAVKSAVSGHGQTDKDGIQKLIRLHLNTTIEFATHDESDALAIAICHSLNKTSPIPRSGKTTKAAKRGGMAGALAHKVRDLTP